MGLDWVCFLDSGGWIGFVLGLIGFVFLGSGEAIMFVSLFGVRGWVGFGVFGIGFVLHN